MTDPTSPDPEDLDALAAEPDDLDGHTIDELAEYLDRGREPADPSIEASESCRHALESLARLQRVSATFLTDLRTEPAEQDDDEPWLAGVMQRITLDSRAGRDITVHETSDGDRVVITEGALRALVRAAGDEVPGFLVGRVRLDGELSAPADGVVITVDVVVAPRTVIPRGAEALRRSLLDRLRRHTHLRDPRIDIVVRDLFIPRTSE